MAGHNQDELTRIRFWYWYVDDETLNEEFLNRIRGRCFGISGALTSQTKMIHCTGNTIHMST